MSPPYRRIEQAGGMRTSLLQLVCELQRDWGRKDTVGAFVKVGSETRGHVVFGTDYPYASEPVSKNFTRNMDNYDHFKAGDLDEINQGARSLFPRLSKQEKTQRRSA